MLSVLVPNSSAIVSFFFGVTSSAFKIRRDFNVLIKEPGCIAVDYKIDLEISLLAGRAKVVRSVYYTV